MVLNSLKRKITVVLKFYYGIETEENIFKGSGGVGAIIKKKLRNTVLDMPKSSSYESLLKYASEKVMLLKVLLLVHIQTVTYPDYTYYYSVKKYKFQKSNLDPINVRSTCNNNSNHSSSNNMIINVNS